MPNLLYKLSYFLLRPALFDSLLQFRCVLLQLKRTDGAEPSFDGVGFPNSCFRVLLLQFLAERLISAGSADNEFAQGSQVSRRFSPYATQSQSAVKPVNGNRQLNSLFRMLGMLFNNNGSTFLGNYPLLQCSQQLSRLDRFGDKIIHTCSQAEISVLLLCIGSHGHHRQHCQQPVFSDLDSKIQTI